LLLRFSSVSYEATIAPQIEVLQVSRGQSPPSTAVQCSLCISVYNWTFLVDTCIRTHLMDAMDWYGYLLHGCFWLNL